MKNVNYVLNTHCHKIKFMLQGGYNRNKYVDFNLHCEIDSYTHLGNLL